MSVLVFGDTHFTGAKLEIQLECLQKRIEEVKPSLIIHTGDVFDVGDVGDITSPASSIIKYLTTFIEAYEIPWIMIAGNHDYTKRACALDFFHHPLITTVTENKSFRINVENEQVNVITIPWKHGLANQAESYLLKQYRKLIKRGSKTPRIWLFGHADLSGFSHKGRELCPDSSAFCLDSDIRKKLRLEVGFFGHIHHKNLIDRYFGYLGSVWPNNFGEVTHSGTYAVYSEGQWNINHNIKTSHGPLYFYLEDNKFPKVSEQVPLYLQNISCSDENLKAFVDSHNVVSCKKKSTFKSNVVKVKIESNSDLDSTLRDYCEAKNIDCSSPLFMSIWDKYKPSLNNFSAENNKLSNVEIKQVGCCSNLNLNLSPNLTAITGPTGSGKTTLLESIILALYGKLPSGRTLGSMLDKTSSVSVSTSESKWTRSWSEPKYKINEEAVSDSTYHNSVEIKWGSYTNFLSSAYRSQRNVNNLITDSPGNRIQSLRDLFELSSFQKQYDALKVEFRKMTSPKIREDQILTKKKELEEEISDKQDRLAELYSTLQDLVVSSYTKTSSYQEDLKKELDETVNLLQKRTLALLQILNTVKVKQDSYAEALVRFKERSKKAGCLKDGTTLPCPLLDEPIKPESHPLLDLGLVPNTDLKQFVLDLTRIPDTHLSKDLVAQIEDITCLPSKIAILKNDLDITASINVDNTVRIAEVKSEQNVILSDVKQKQSIISQLETELKSLLDQKIEYEYTETILNILGPYGLVQWWMELRLPELQATINQELEYFDEVGISDVQFEFSLSSSPKLEITFLSKGVRVDVGAASGGQEALLSLLLRYALSGRLMLLDEPFVGMDSVLSGRVGSWLAEKSKDRQIIVSTHEPSVATWADVVVEVA